ncbi:MAG: right-handed parallel beta-helix repeat-containing protein [bacterium]|nr:right-handed parallel beta-helix repeat-containing protein [bacterium]
MKKKILIGLAVFLFLVGGFFVYSLIPQQVQNRDIFGVLARSQIWSGQINVIGDILVMPWATLIIRPGTNVIVSANKDAYNLIGWQTCDGIKNYDMLIGIKKEDNYNCGVHLNEPYRDEKHHITILILGTLKAVGTEENRIVFKSDSRNPTIYDWNSLVIIRGVLSYANLENYRGIATTLGGIEISHNNLKNIGECGICMTNSKAKILFNTISYAGHELIDMHNSSPIIRQNNLGPNPQNAGIIVDGGSPQIIANEIEECGVAIAFISPPNQPIIEDNIFLNNNSNIADNY